MTECQGCGAWNDASRTLCVLCGTPLTEIDEWDAAADPPPLPPLPDGGLATAMPTWLREPPASAARPAPLLAPPVIDPPLPPPPVAKLPPLGPRADPRTFLDDDDFPLWLRELAARQAMQPAPEPDGQAGMPTAFRREAIWPNWPEGAVPPALHIFKPASPAAPDSAQPPPSSLPSPPASDHRPARDPWETALLVLLFLGVVAAALWALVSNGVFGPAW